MVPLLIDLKNLSLLVTVIVIIIPLSEVKRKMCKYTCSTIHV